MPPQAADIEEAIIGAVLLVPECLDDVLQYLTPQMFYKAAHQSIFEAIVALAQKNQKPDLLTLTAELKSRSQLENIGGAHTLAQMLGKVTSTVNLLPYCQIIVQKAGLRSLINVAANTLTTAYDAGADFFSLLEAQQQSLFSIATTIHKKNFKTAPDLATEAISFLDAMMDATSDVTGVPTGFKTLDAVTQGWQPTDLIILAARPSVGKTAFALNMAIYAAVNNAGVGFFSLEMSSSQLTRRGISILSQIPMEHINRGWFTKNPDKYIEAVDRLSQLPIFVDDTSSISITELRAKARQMVLKHQVKIIMVDYLQLMTGTQTGNREQEISSISRSLKALAKDLNVPVIALSQLSRQIETRKEGSEPKLSDLRESGAIEQDADIVAFLYRFDYQKTEVDPALANQTFLKIAKQRNGPLATIVLNSKLSTQTFTDATHTASAQTFTQQF